MAEANVLTVPLSKFENDGYRLIFKSTVTSWILPLSGYLQPAGSKKPVAVSDASMSELAAFTVGGGEFWFAHELEEL